MNILSSVRFQEHQTAHVSVWRGAQLDPIRSSTTQCDISRFNSTSFDSPCRLIRCSTTQFDATRITSIQLNSIRFKSTQFDLAQLNSIQIFSIVSTRGKLIQLGTVKFETTVEPIPFDLARCNSIRLNSARLDSK